MGWRADGADANKWGTGLAHVCDSFRVKPSTSFYINIKFLKTVHSAAVLEFLLVKKSSSAPNIYISMETG